MKSFSIVLPLLAAVVVFAGCSSTPEPAPVAEEPVEHTVYVDVQEVAVEVGANLMAGDVVGAEEALMTVESPEDYQVLFSLLFDRAQGLARERDYEGCIRINRFLVKVYPEERPAKEALIYSLWLWRAQSGEPHDAATIAEIQAVTARLRADGGEVPVWIDIALTQAAIDGGDLEAARVAMNRFNARWDREPPALRAYVGELSKYIESNTAN
jgi:hypothetical protein